MGQILDFSIWSLISGLFQFLQETDTNQDWTWETPEKFLWEVSEWIIYQPSMQLWLPGKVIGRHMKGEGGGGKRNTFESTKVVQMVQRQCWEGHLGVWAKVTVARRPTHPRSYPTLPTLIWFPGKLHCSENSVRLQKDLHIQHPILRVAIP